MLAIAQARGSYAIMKKEQTLCSNALAIGGTLLPHPFGIAFFQPDRHFLLACVGGSRLIGSDRRLRQQPIADGLVGSST